MSRPAHTPLFAFGPEALESRRLLSAAGLSHGVLHVAGAPKVANVIDVQLVDGQLVVDIQSPGAKGATSLHKTFNAANLKRIDVTGGKLADHITVGTTSTILAKVRVHGLAGDDVITTGAEDDFVEAGAGNDTVNAGDGTNLVRGGLGNDTLTTGVGNDRLNGGLGDDDIMAGGGNDVVRGEAGDDMIDAGDGDDLVFGGKGADVIMGGMGNDVLWGSKDDDQLDGGDGDDKLGGIVGANKMTGGLGHDTFVVVGLDQNPDNDYDPDQDLLQLVKPKADDGDKPPAI